MAIIALKNLSTLRLKFNCGKDDEGNAIRKTRSYSNLKPDADEQDVYDVGVMLASLVDYSLMEVIKADTTTLSE
jgi:hypothetical protein